MYRLLYFQGDYVFHLKVYLIDHLYGPMLYLRHVLQHKGQVTVMHYELTRTFVAEVSIDQLNEILILLDFLT